VAVFGCVVECFCYGPLCAQSWFCVKSFLFFVKSFLCVFVKGYVLRLKTRLMAFAPNSFVFCV